MSRIVGPAGDIEVRAAELSDVPAVIRLLQEDRRYTAPADEPAADHESYRAVFRRIAANPDQSLLVAVSNQTVVGTLQVTMIDYMIHRARPVAQVEAVRVSTAWQGRGIGTLLMESAVRLARARGAWRMQLTTHKTRVDAHRFYARLGFEATHEGMKLTLT